MNLRRWEGHYFSSGPVTGEDYLELQKLMKSDLKKQCKTVGYELHEFLNSHYSFSAVVKSPTGQYFYISLSDVRSGNDWADKVLYRTMAHANDWHGGGNNYTDWNNVMSAIVDLEVREARRLCLKD